MFGANDQEEIVEEEVPVSVAPAAQSGEMLNSHIASSTSASSIPDYTSPLSTTMTNSSSFGNYSYGVEEDTSAFKYAHNARFSVKFIFIPSLPLLAVLTRYCNACDNVLGLGRQNTMWNSKREPQRSKRHAQIREPTDAPSSTSCSLNIVRKCRRPRLPIVNTRPAHLTLKQRVETNGNKSPAIWAPRWNAKVLAILLASVRLCSSKSTNYFPLLKQSAWNKLDFQFLSSNEISHFDMEIMRLFLIEKFEILHSLAELGKRRLFVKIESQPWFSAFGDFLSWYQAYLTPWWTTILLKKNATTRCFGVPNFQFPSTTNSVKCTQLQNYWSPFHRNANACKKSMNKKMCWWKVPPRAKINQTHFVVYRVQVTSSILFILIHLGLHYIGDAFRFPDTVMLAQIGGKICRTSRRTHIGLQRHVIRKQSTETMTSALNIHELTLVWLIERHSRPKYWREEIKITNGFVTSTESYAKESHGVKIEGRAIYLDAQATTPIDPRVLDSMLPFYTQQYGNPHSRTHFYGWENEDAIESAREVCVLKCCVWGAQSFCCS